MIMNTDFIYPVGSIYITTDTNFNPNIRFSGTWARLEGDVYLKNVPSSSGQPIGNYGGTSSNHTIPLTSIPSHNHPAYTYGLGGDIATEGLNAQVVWTTQMRSSQYAVSVQNTGGSQPYYPYYYGIICWHRTA